MALIICPECGKEFSDKAPACPNCGCPTSEIAKSFSSGSSVDAEAKMLSKVDEVLAKARKASAAYEVSAMYIEETVSRTTINISQQSSRDSLRSIVRSCADACDKLYLAYQNLILEMDSELKRYLSQNPGAYAIRAVAGTMEWLNEESKIQNNYAAQFDGVDLGQLVKAQYYPRSENLETARFWKSKFNEQPDKGNAEAKWTEKLRDHINLASKEDREARSNAINARLEGMRILRQLEKEEKEQLRKEYEGKKEEFQSRYAEIRKRMEYCRPAADLLFFRNSNYGYVTSSGMPRINWDENHVGCVIRRMHDLKQIVCLGDGVIGLGKNGRCQIAGNFNPDGYKDADIESCRSWRNVRKLAASVNNNHLIGIREDGTCVVTRTKYNYGLEQAASWTEIVDVVCEDYFAAGLRKDGTVVIAGTGNIPDSLRKTYSGQKDIIAIFNYDTWRFVALKKDGSLLPDIPELTQPAASAKDIIAVAKCSGGPVFLQADGTVIKAEMDYGNNAPKKRSPVPGLKNVVAIYTGSYEFAALCEDGYFWVYDRSGVYILNKEAPIFKSYKEFASELNLLADRKAKGLCPNCGGEFEKKLFGWKCKECGHNKDY